MSKSLCVHIKRLASNKLLIICAASMLLAALAAIILSVFIENDFSISPYGKPLTDPVFIEQDIVRTEEMLAHGAINDKERLHLELSAAKSKFFLSTNTDIYDYYNGSLDTKNAGALISERIFLYGTLILALFSIFSAYFIYGGKYNGHFRMAVMSGIKRKPLFTGVNGAGLGAVLIAYFIIFAAGLIAVSFSPDIRIFIADPFTLNVASVSVFTWFYAQYLAMLVISLLLYSLVVFLSTLFKKRSTALGLTAFFCIIPFPIIRGMTVTNPTYTYLNTAFFPAYGLINLAVNAFTSAYLIALVAHVAAAFGLIFISYRIFKRQEL